MIGDEVRALAISLARGDRDLADDFIQEAEIAWWRKELRAEHPDHKRYWLARHMINDARTYWSREKRRLEILRTSAPALELSDDPTFIVQHNRYVRERERENARRRRRTAQRRAAGLVGHEVMHGEAYREHVRAQQRARRQRMRDAG